MLKFNTSKTELFLIGSSQQLSKLNNPVAICLQGIEIVTAETVRNLGIIMDSHLKLTAHINHVFKVSMHHLRNISTIRYLTPEACKSLVHALVTSCIDYCNSHLYGYNQSLIHRLQLIQNYAARLIVRIPKYSHITPVIRTYIGFQLQPGFTSRYSSFYCVHGHGPSCLKDLLYRRAPLRSGLRSQHRLLLEVPRSTADRAFSICGPKLWSRLPADLQNITTLQLFRSKLSFFI